MGKKELVVDDLTWTIRPIQQDDVAFVVSSWTKHYPSKLRSIIRPTLIQKLMSANCYVAECDGVLIGFVVVGLGSVVHYTYTKFIYRTRGVCNSLLTHAVGRTTNILCSELPNKETLKARFEESDEENLWKKK